MINLEAFKSLVDMPVGGFAPKPTSLTDGQVEASVQLWASADGQTRIGIWECTPGRFTADRSTTAEFCHILSGAASVTNQDGGGSRDLGPGDLLVLPIGWTGEWTIHTPVKKLYVLQASG